MEKEERSERGGVEERGGGARVESEVTAPTVSQQLGVQVSQLEFQKLHIVIRVGRGREDDSHFLSNQVDTAMKHQTQL